MPDRETKRNQETQTEQEPKGHLSSRSLFLHQILARTSPYMWWIHKTIRGERLNDLAQLHRSAAIQNIASLQFLLWLEEIDALTLKSHSSPQIFTITRSSKGTWKSSVVSCSKNNPIDVNFYFFSVIYSSMWSLYLI